MLLFSILGRYFKKILGLLEKSMHFSGHTSWLTPTNLHSKDSWIQSKAQQICTA